MTSRNYCLLGIKYKNQKVSRKIIRRILVDRRKEGGTLGKNERRGKDTVDITIVQSSSTNYSFNNQ